MAAITWRKHQRGAWGHVSYTSKILGAGGQYYINQHFNGFDVMFIPNPVRLGTGATAQEAQSLAQRHYDEAQP
jgi:hypothetical protein